jgi:hypothetical protein
MGSDDAAVLPAPLRPRRHWVMGSMGCWLAQPQSAYNGSLELCASPWVGGTQTLYGLHLATQIMLWLVSVYVSWCAVTATRKQRAPAMAETTAYALGDHLRRCNIDK